jgi:hypothetical protein
VFSDNEKQKTTNRLSHIHENAYNEDVLTVTFQENVVIKSAYNEDVLPMTYKGNVVIENTCQEDVLPMAFKGNVVIKDYKKYTMSTMHETAYREDVDDKTYMKNVVVPNTVANTSSGNDDPADPHQNCVMGKTGTKDDTKRLAITSERGGRGA